jgi:cell division septation protein DedD
MRASEDAMADQATAAAGAETALPGKYNPTDNGIQRIRSYTGLYVVVLGDVAIAGIASYGVLKSGDGAANAQIVAILTSAFTAIGTMTTAYFGIRGMSNTAQSAVMQGAPDTTTQQTTDTTTTSTTTTPTTTTTTTETTPTSAETTDAPTAGEGEDTDQSEGADEGEGTGEGGKPDEVP